MYSIPPWPSFVASTAAYRRRSFSLKRVEQPLHHPFDSRCIGVHVALPDADSPIQGPDIIPQANREVIPGPFLSCTFPEIGPST